MDELEDNVNRKYLATKYTDDWEVETDRGWFPVKSVSKTIEYDIWLVETCTHKVLKCADNHILFREGFVQVFVKDLKVGDEVITKDGIEKVIKVYNTCEKDVMYDIDVDSEFKRFYTDNILSHNSTVVSLYILWYAMYSVEPINTIILGNKAKTAQGILADIKMAYEELAPFLKRGVVEYNKTSIEFDNRSVIQTGATTKDSIRSESVSFLLLDEFAHVAPHIAEEFYEAALPTISCIVGDTLILTDKGYEKIQNYKLKDSQIGDYKEVDNMQVFGKKGLEKVSHFYNSPESKTKKITTRYGFQIECTLNHPLVVNDDCGCDMKKGKDIKIGEYLKIFENMQQYGDEDKKQFKIDYFMRYSKEPKQEIINGISKDFAYMIGGYLAEGWISKSSKKVYICNTDDEFRDIYLKYGFKIVSKRNERLCSEQVEYFKFKYILGDTWDKKCYDKEIPEIILKSSKETQKQVLSGIIDGDGCVLEDGSVEITSTSRKLLAQIQLMFINMGIVTRLKKCSVNRDIIDERIMPSGKTLKSLCQSWRLIIPKGFSKRILQEFDLKISRKKNRLLERCKSERDIEKQKKIIFTEWMIKSIDNLISLKLINKCQLRYTVGVRMEKWKVGNSIKVSSFRKFIDCFEKLLDGKNEDFLKLKDLINENCFYDEIVSIEDSENETFDLTCPNTHTFLQNGILGSNTGGKICVVSTPKGNTNLFYRLYRGAEEGNNGFVPFTIDWKEAPRYDESGKVIPPEIFKERMINASSLQSWYQEYEAKFIGSSKTLIAGDKLEELGRKVKGNDPESTYLHWKCWEQPKAKHIYVIGVDTAKGVEQDYSVIQIVDITRKNLYKQVAVYANNQIDPFDFTDKVCELGKLYNNAYVIIENNTYGHEVCRKLWNELEYENLFKEYKKKEYGVTAGVKTKGLATSLMKRYIENSNMIINDESTYKQLCGFVEVNPDIYRCEEGKNNYDDLVMALAWVCYFIGSEFWREWEEYIRNDVAGQTENINIKEKESFDPMMFEEVYDRDRDRENLFYGDEDLMM